MTLKINDLILERYLIEDVIAQGGMGAIYRAFDQNLSIRVAFKENLYPSEESTRQFRREATILANVRHPHLPRVSNHFVIPGQGQYLVMDYIEGDDLRDRINRVGVLPTEEVILIGAAISDALIYLHSCQPPIIHRDIKPGNIKITPDGHIFLVDFGLAKIDQGAVTTMGAQSLTPGYAPPEQYGQGTTPRSDIYSLGATLYAALTCQVPEDGLARATNSVQLTPLRKHNPKVPYSLSTVIEKAMAVKPVDRYQDALEFKQAILGASNAAQNKNRESINYSLSPSSSVQPENPPYEIHQEPIPGQTMNSLRQVLGGFTQKSSRQSGSQPPRGISKNITWMIGVGAVLFLCAVGIIVVIILGFGPGKALWSRTISTQTQPLPVVEQINATITSSPVSVVLTSTLPPMETSVSPTLEIISPPTPTLQQDSNGMGQIAFASSRSGVPQIFFMNNDGGEVKQITYLPEGACQPDWSPDGTRLVITSPCRDHQDTYKGSSLFFIKVDGSGLQPMASVPGGDFDPAWSPDGSAVIFTSFRDGNFPNLYLYNLNTRSTLRLSKPNNYDHRPVWAPQGDLIAYETVRNDQRQIWLMHPDGSMQGAFTTPDIAAAEPGWSPDGTLIVFSKGTDVPWLAAQQSKSSAPDQNVAESIRPAWNADYSPDGNWLLFEGLTAEGDMEIFRMMAGGGVGLTRLTNQTGKDFDPAWHPKTN